ncbi:MAG: DUF481 domain-containing protein [Lysobacterales bacterium]
MIRAMIFFVITLLCCHPAWGDGDKTDVVILKNGDKLTGEVKALRAGILQFATDAMGTVAIEWRYIDQVISTENQSVETTDGKLYLGRLTSESEGDAVGVQTEERMVTLDTDDVFAVWPVKSTFWERSDFDVSVGLDYQKSTGIADFNLAASWQHRRFDRLTEASLSSDLTRQSGADDQTRYQLQFAHQYIRQNGRTSAWLASAERNDSLGLDYRFYAGGLYGKYLLRESDHWLSLGAGLVGTEEKYAGASANTGLEAVADARFDLYRYADPERSLQTRLTLFPSLTESGRLRSEFTTTFKLELINDLYWMMQFYYQSDTDPPPQAVNSTDYGITTGVGWSP